MVKELTETYLPENILFRDEQIKIIENVFEECEKNNEGENLVLCGPTGNGKTLVIDYIKSNNKDVYLFSKSSEKGTAFQMFKDLFNIQDSRTIGNLVQRGIQKLKINPKLMIFDEINRLDRKELKTFFSCLNEISRETELPMIVITNIFGINQYMREDQKVSLQFRFIDFPPYKPDELFKIFLERKKEIEKNNKEIKIDENDLSNICNYVYGKGTGSARQVRKVLNECIKSKDFSMNHIQKIIEGSFDESCFLRIANMPRSDINFFKVILELTSLKKNREQPLSISYNEIKEKMKIDISRISQYVETFENEYYLIKSEYPSGRGRKRLILLDQYFFNIALKSKSMKIIDEMKYLFENLIDN